MHSRVHHQLTSSVNEYWQPPHYDPQPWFKSRRFVIFTIAFLASAAITLSYVFSRPAIYLSYATLLTVAKTAIDLPSNDADIQHVAIQKQILLGSELLAETSRRLKSTDTDGTPINLSVAEIRQMLDVKPVIETNLIEMAAEGTDPEKLPVLINTWIDVYLDARAEEVSRLLGDTTQILQNELHGLAEKITAKRVELDQFRRSHDISSIEREENEALARLKGLNESLNIASEEEVKTKARLDAINRAIENGQAVVPQEDTRTLSLLEDRAQQLREELADLNLRYTKEYLELSPTLKVIPEQLASLESEIRRMRQSGQTIVQSDAQQEYAAAKQAVSEIRKQLDEHKKKATKFSTRFSEHQALQADLEGLETLYRDTQDRLAQVEARYAGKYPQVDVIERAFLPSAPIRPNYFLDAIIAVTGSILFSLFCIWISEFLTRKTKPEPVINLSGIHLYNKDMSPDSLGIPQQSVNALPQQHPVLGNPPPQELSAQQIGTLLQHAGNREKLLIALLLSGVTLEEAPAIGKEDIDFENEKLIVKSESPRIIPLNPALKSLFAKTTYRLVSASGDPLSSEDLAALITCAILDADLSGADEINAASLRQTYIIYLVKQGIRLSELEKITGYIPPKELSSYSIYSPPGPKRAYEVIDKVYPELLNIDQIR
ncbi:MAG TPA: integrase [Nitrosomonas sp.]|nr:integrase [Nitrosomonas sp.]